MTRFIDAAVRTESVLRRWEDRVKLRLLHIVFVTVDRLQSCVAVDRETVGPIAKNWT